MADEASVSVEADLDRIDTRQDYELRRWARRLGATLDEVRDAVMTVGNAAEAVRRHLRR